MSVAADHSIRCGIVLAAGEGKRLQPLVHRLRGDTLPKQYVSFIGTRSMLEHTFDRAEQLIDRDRVFTVIGQNHLSYPTVKRQLSGRSKATVIVQPENKDTGPGVLLPLMHIYKRYPECTVAVFPSDHFVLEEDLFMSHISFAFQVVERNPALLVLLGMEPNEPEAEYGYVLPHGDGPEETLGLSIRRVSRFVEKPNRNAAQELMFRGGLWNTMVMVFKIKTLLDIVRNLAPELYGSFDEILKAIGTPKEKNKIAEIYQRLKPTNFSTGILEMLPVRHPSCLSVLSVRDVLWSDWGLPRSIASVLRKIGYHRGPHGEDAVADNRLDKIFNDGAEPRTEIWERNETTGAGKIQVRREGFKRFPQPPALTSPTR